MHHRLLSGLAAAVVSIGAATSANADGSYIVTNRGHQIVQAPSGQGAYDDGLMPLYHGANQHVTLIKSVDDAAALNVNHNTHYVNPDTQHMSRRPGRIDHNHSLMRAQRAYQNLHNLPTRVIRRVPVVVVVDRHEVRPVLIMLKPEHLRNRDTNEPVKTPLIPSVPRNEKPEGGDDANLMAAAY